MSQSVDKYGLRRPLLFASFLTALGSVIKCINLTSTGYTANLLGQSLCAFGQAFFLSIPTKVC